MATYPRVVETIFSVRYPLAAPTPRPPVRRAECGRTRGRAGRRIVSKHLGGVSPPPPPTRTSDVVAHATADSLAASEEGIADDREDSENDQSFHTTSPFSRAVAAPPQRAAGRPGRLFSIRYPSCDGHRRFVALEAVPGQEQFLADLADPALRHAEPLGRGAGGLAVGQERGDLPQAARQELQPRARSRCGRWPSRQARRACPRRGSRPTPPPPNRSDRAARPGGSSSAGSNRSTRRGQLSLPPTLRPSRVWETPNRASALGKATSVLPNSTSRA